MNVCFQEVIDSLVNQAVTRQRGYTAERLGNDAYSEMAVAFGCARMAGVQMTLVLDDQNRGRKSSLQTAPQPLRAAGFRGIHMFA
jgi:hypothetical protein